MAALRTRIAIGLAVALGLLAGPASAVQQGYWHAARPESGSCGFCHGLSQGTGPVPLLLLEGLPAQYVPNSSYDVTILVLGPLLPIAGFNLEVNGGTLVALPSDVPLVGGVSQTLFFVSECEALQKDTQCSGSDCQVRIAEGCPVYGPETPGCECPPANRNDTSLCRACNAATIVSAQAAHASPAIVPVWKVRWNAPDCGYGDATFYLAGNSANGNDDDDEADVWGVLPAPRVVPSASCAP